MIENKILELMNDIEYGWVDKYGNKHIDDYDTFSSEYILETSDEVINNRIGVCWDQVEFEREQFKDYNYKTFFIVYYDGGECPTHTFLVYEKDNKYYWFEHAWKKYKGIFEYNSLEELIINVKNKFIDDKLNNFDEENLKIYEYSKPKEHIGVDEFFKHCESGNEY